MLLNLAKKARRRSWCAIWIFPLDIIFIDGEAGKIVKIDKNLKAEGENPKKFYNSGAPVDYVLEVNAGYADSHNIKAGDKIRVIFMKFNFDYKKIFLIIFLVELLSAFKLFFPDAQ